MWDTYHRLFCFFAWDFYLVGTQDVEVRKSLQYSPHPLYKLYNNIFFTVCSFRIVQKNESPTAEILLFSNERSSESDFGRQCTISTRANHFPVLNSADLNGYDYIPSGEM